MRNVKTMGLGLLLAAFLATPSSARAQYFFGGSPNPWSFGSWGGFGNWGGGYGFGGMPYSYGSNWNYSSPYYYNYYPSYAPIVLPGFGASDPVCACRALYPAIAEPTADIIRNALVADEKDKARIDIQLPSAGAKVYLDGVPTKQTGLDRMFITPKLNAGAKYVMNVEVIWQTDSGRERTIRRQVTMRAGEITTLDMRGGN